MTRDWEEKASDRARSADFYCDCTEYRYMHPWMRMYCMVRHPIPYIVGMNLAIRAFQVFLSSVFSATPTNPDLRCSSMIRQWQKEKKKRTRCQLVLVETSGMHQIRIAGWHYYYVCMSRWTLTRQYHSRGFGALGGLLPAPWQYAACSTTK